MQWQASGAGCNLSSCAQDVPPCQFLCLELMLGIVHIKCVRCQVRSTDTRKLIRTVVVQYQGVELGTSVDCKQLHATQQSVCHCVDGGAGRTLVGAPQQSRMPMLLELQVLAEPSPTTWHPLLTRSASRVILPAAAPMPSLHTSGSCRSHMRAGPCICRCTCSHRACCPSAAWPPARLSCATSLPSGKCGHSL